MRKSLAVLAFAVPLTLSACALPETPSAVQPAEAGDGKPEDRRAGKVPVKITAKRVAFKPGILNTGGKFSCAKVTVTNQTDKNLQVNPYFFEVTDATSEKKNAAVGEAAGEFRDVTLSPGEKASGVVCADGASPIKEVSFERSGLGTRYRAAVS